MVLLFSNLEGENHSLDPHGFAYRRPNMNFPYESTPICPPPSLIQKAHQFQQQPSFSSMVNVSIGTSSSSIMEPPSNQSFYGNNYTPMWPEEEKMVGTKRPYPFSMDHQSGPSFLCKFPPTYVPPLTRSDESGPSGNGGTVNVEPSNPIFRESPSSSNFMPELNPKNVAKENGDLNGDFLTLAPPETALAIPSSKHRHPSVNLVLHSRELSEFESLPYQGSGEDPVHNQTGPSGSAQKQPFYSFFPSEKALTGQETAALSSCSEKEGENLDLNLKL